MALRLARPGPARPWLRCLAATALAVVSLGIGLVGLADPAGAHATLVAVDPADGARLDAAPRAVELTFSERVTASLGGIRVVDTEGTRVDEGAVRVDGTSVSVPLADDLDEGTYVITYRVISADGHPVRGASVFAVGDAPVDAAAAGRLQGGGDDRAWEVLGAFGRGVAYAGTLLAAGGVLFLAYAHRGGAERTRLVAVVRVAAAVGALAGCIALPVQAALGTGRGAGALLDDGVLGAVIDDGVGLGLALALAGLAVLALWVDRRPVLATVGAAVAATSFAATGHTRAGDAAGIATAADAAHLLAVAVWGGGIVLLLATVVLRRRADPSLGAAAGADDGDAATGAIVVRFSTLATGGLVGAAATGAVLSWHEVRTVDALTGTGYGRLLLVKVAVVAAIAVLGAYNHLRLVPAIRQGKVRAALRHLRPVLVLEAVGLVAVVALTAVLVVVTPGRTEAAGGPAERIVELGEVGSVQLVVAPARAGFNQIHLYTYDPTGRPTQLADEIQLELELPEAGIGPLIRTATRAGPAHAQLNSEDLALAGTWEITVRVRVDRFTEVSGRTEVPVGG